MDGESSRRRPRVQLRSVSILIERGSQAASIVTS